MNRSPLWWAVIVGLAFSAGTVVGLYALPGGNQTFTGEVGDTMCGRQHMEGAPTDCTRTCVAQGSKYALVVGDKIYVLDVTDKAALATLNQQAGKKAAVTGVLEGSVIHVSSVSAK